MIEGEVEGWRECAVWCEAENSGTLLLSCAHTQKCLKRNFPLLLFLSLTPQVYSYFIEATLCFVWQLQEHGSFSQAIFI